MVSIGDPLAELSEYEKRHLVNHLVEAERTNEIHNLLALEGGDRNNAWYTAQEISGNLGGYLDDVNTAWKLAEADGDIVHQVRYALYSSSIGAISANISYALVALSLDLEILTPEHALTLVRAIPDEHVRAWAIASIASRLSEEQRKSTLTHEEISHLNMHGNLLGERDLPVDWNSPDVARKEIQLDEDSSLNRLPEVDEYLSYEELPAVLEAALALEDEIWRMMMLQELAKYLTPDLSVRAFEAVAAMKFYQRGFFGGAMEYQADILYQLAGNIPTELLTELLRHAMEKVNQIGDQWQQLVAYTHLSQYLPTDIAANVAEDAIKAADQIGENDIGGKTIALGEIVPYLPSDLQIEAFAETLYSVSYFKTHPQGSYDEDEYVRITNELVQYLRPNYFLKAWATIKKGRGSGVFLDLTRRAIRRYLVNAGWIKELSWRDYITSQISKENLELSGTGQAVEDMSNADLLLAALSSEEEVRIKATILDDLVYDMPVDVLPHAVSAAIEIQNSWFDTDNPKHWSILSLAPHLGELGKRQPEQIHILIPKILRSLENQPRPDSLRVINAMLEFLFSSDTGEENEMACGIFLAIEDTCRWWP